VKSSANNARLRLIVRGRVQGVAFRFATADEAESLGLKGWVRNLSDGGVEIVAEGPRPQLELLAAWAHEGPRMARVTEVSEEWSEFKNEFKGFRIR
jgi:acylphosphatase